MTHKTPRRYRMRSFLRMLGGAAAVVLSCSLGAGGAQARPNIVLIVADDWAHNDLGIAGHPLLKTPNLDRLATEGVRFENAFTPNLMWSE